MNEWLTYTLISLALGLLFFILMRRQQTVYANRWLLKKIRQEPADNEPYLQALKELKPNNRQVLKVTLGLLLMVVPVSLYLNYRLFSHTDAIQQQQQPPSIEQALAQLEQNLVENPNDLEGQVLYARAMMSMQNFEAAVTALKKAHELAPDDANILTDLAEAIAFKNNTGSFIGEPEKYLQQALAINPYQQKAMWLTGIVAFEKSEFAEAENTWIRLIELIQDPKVKATIIKQINQAKSAQNKPLLTVSADSDSTTETARVTYTIQLDADDAIKSLELPATTRLFIAAKAPAGPPMPIAAVNIVPPFDWPLNIALTDQHNLTSDRQLNDFKEIILTARLSLNGDAGQSDYQAEEQLVGPKSTDIQMRIKP